MHKYFLCFILVGFCSIIKAQSVLLKEVRENFKQGVRDGAVCKKYHELLKSNAKTGSEKGYEAAYQMFMAKHTGNPIRKMKYFNSGKDLLEKQIANSPSNVDLRFIRFSIQYHTPSFLGYKDNITEDKLFLVDNLYKLEDIEGKAVLFKYLKGMNLFTEQELSLLGR